MMHRSRTKPTFAVPREMAERKPAHGEPCTGCGMCCFMSLCTLAQHVFHAGEFEGPCPALMLGSDGRSACGLVMTGTRPYRDAAALLVRAGERCDCRVNGEPINHAFHAYQDRNDAVNADAVRYARNLWGMPCT